MRIKRLKVLDYRNLQNFEIQPDVNNQTTIILGRNGAGKSNYIELLVEIFRDLEASAISTFHYELDYEVYGNNIQIVNDPTGKPKQRFLVNSKKLSKKILQRG